MVRMRTLKTESFLNCMIGGVVPSLHTKYKSYLSRKKQTVFEVSVTFKCLCHKLQDKSYNFAVCSSHDDVKIGVFILVMVACDFEGQNITQQTVLILKN